MNTATFPMPPTCPYCGGIAHAVASCPEVSAIEYFKDGTIKRVEKRPRQPSPQTFHYTISTSGSDLTGTAGWPNIKTK